MSYSLGRPGGAQKTLVGTTAEAIDLTALVDREVYIWSDDQDLWFGWAATAATPALEVVTNDLAASLTANKADRTAKSVKSKRLVYAGCPFLIVATVTGTGTVHVKVCSDKIRR